MYSNYLKGQTAFSYHCFIVSSAGCLSNHCVLDQTSAKLYVTFKPVQMCHGWLTEAVDGVQFFLLQCAMQTGTPVKDRMHCHLCYMCCILGVLHV